MANIFQVKNPAGEVKFAVDDQGDVSVGAANLGGEVVPAEGVPAGVILMWHGLLANIPAGWVLCDGANGTPDLRGKFVKGAAADQEAGTTGGAATHQHAAHEHTPAGTVSQPTLAMNALSGGTRKGGTSNPAAIIENGNVPTGTVSQPTFAGTPASLAHDAVNHEPPHYEVVFIMKT